MSNYCKDCKQTFLSRVTFDYHDCQVESANDPIKPEHYRKGIQPIEVMQKTFTPEQYEGFLVGNILKYVMRFPHKNGVEDLKKAKEYLSILIAEKEKPLS